MNFRCDVYVGYHSMQVALIGNVVVEVFGGCLFFLAALFVLKDRLRVHEYLTSKSYAAPLPRFELFFKNLSDSKHRLSIAINFQSEVGQQNIIFFQNIQMKNGQNKKP